ncbi:MAG: hypothetical protein IJL17_06955, partial [Kiritimatiellae bacterium]|nr:hypothetical protein [Kiritimatiellia bacterium]
MVKTCTCMGAVGLACLAACGAAKFRAPAETPAERVPGRIWIEAEGFTEYGSWRIDTQFTHKMGSAYLICPGANKPTTAPARTEVSIPRAGTWRAWARTKDWLPAFSPGRFALEVGGRRGVVLGASKKGWGWENAGDFDLAAGKVELALVDLSGAYARCDAILLTTDLAYVPQDVCDKRDPPVCDGGEYDVVVVGAGPGGMGASLG